MRWPAILVLVWLTWPAAFCAAGDVDAALAAGLARKEFLEAELVLAQKPQFYAVFDFDAGAVQLKARGVVFRQWSAAEASGYWGADPPLGPLVLSERSPGLALQRVVVKPPEAPGKDEAASPSSDNTATAPPADALEVGDMPSRYQLHFADGTLVSVAPRPADFAGRVGALGRSFLRRGLLPLQALWRRMREQPRVEVDLTLEEADARALYWAFAEGMSALFRYPAE